ncbi:MAG: hypothetical protein IT445_02805 [Phycisphaeraceae bacterium]|nr:hypothetical protein [Phycisphaeraceae bacterium]
MAESSTPLISCPNCGKLFKWKPKLAGRKVTCTGCQQPLRMPKSGDGKFEAVGGLLKDKQDLKKLNEASQGAYELSLSDSDVEDVHMDANAGRVATKAAAPTNCPSCNSKLKPGAVLCINCGYNIAEGKKINTAMGSGGRADKKSRQAARDQVDAKSSADMASLSAGAYSSLTAQYQKDADRQDEEQKRMKRQRIMKMVMLAFSLAILGVAAFITLRTFEII